MVRATCIFCETKLPSSKSEHYIIAAIGGKKHSRHLICNHHNETLGLEVDNRLAQETAPLNNLLATTSGRRKPAPTLQTTGPDGSKGYALKPGAQIVKLKADVKQEVVDGQLRLDMSGDASKPELLRKVFRQVIAGHSKTIDDIDTSGLRVTHTQEPSQTHVSVSLESTECHRALCKIALLLFAEEVGTSAVRQASFAPIREFILNSSGVSTDFISANSSQKFVAHDGLHPPGPPVHSFVVHADSEIGCLAAVSLFGLFTYSLRLSQTWSSAQVCIIHTVDPVLGEHRAASGNWPYPINAPDESERDQRVEQEAHRQLVDIANERATSIQNEELVRLCIQNQLTLSGETQLTEELLKRVLHEVKGRLLAMQKGQGYTSDLNTEGFLLPPCVDKDS